MMTRKRITNVLTIAVVAMVVGMFAGPVHAADLYRDVGDGDWENGGDVEWGTAPGGPYTAAAWNNATPDSAIFEGTAGTVTLGGNISVSSISLESTGIYTIEGNALNFAAGGSIVLPGDGYHSIHNINSAITGSPTVSILQNQGAKGIVGGVGSVYRGLTLAPTNGTVTLGAADLRGGLWLGGTTTGNVLTGPVTQGSQRAALAKIGAGTWTVNGDVAVGKVAIGEGRLINNGTLSTDYGGVFLGGGEFHYNNPLSIGNNILTLQGGSLDNTSGGAIAVPGAAYQPLQTWTSEGGTFIGTDDLDLGTGNVTLSGNPTVIISAGTLTVGGVIGDGAMAYGLTKAGAGTLKLTGTNTYNGSTTVEEGTLSLSQVYLDDDAFLIVSNGATLNLDYTGTDDVFMLTIGGVNMAAGTWGANGNAGATYTTNAITGNGIINNLGGLAPANTWYCNGNSTNASGIGDGAVAGGAGTWSTNVANWDGGVTAYSAWPNTTNDKAIFRAVAGVVDLQSDITLGEILIDGVNSYTIGSNPETQVLNFGGTNRITLDGVRATFRAGVTGNPDLTIPDAGSLLPDAQDMHFGLISGVPANATLTLGGSTTGNTAAAITNNSQWAKLTKYGSSTWTVGDLTIGQLALQAGKLVINGTFTHTAGGRASTFTGGTLAGTGTIMSDATFTTVPVGGTLAPGDPTGTLTVTNNNCTILGTNAISISGAACSRLVVDGDLDVRAATLSIDASAASGASEYLIASCSGTLTGPFAATTGLPGSWTVDYDTPKQIRLIPPPTTGTVLIIR